MTPACSVNASRVFGMRLQCATIQPMQLSSTDATLSQCVGITRRQSMHRDKDSSCSHVSIYSMNADLL